MLAQSDVYPLHCAPDHVAVIHTRPLSRPPWDTGRPRRALFSLLSEYAQAPT